MTYAAYIHDHKLEFIKNPMDYDEAKKILNCTNIGAMEIQVGYQWFVLFWDMDEPDVNSIIPIVKKKYSWEKVIDKSKCLVCGILESEKIGVKNSFSCGSLSVYNYDLTKKGKTNNQ